MFQDSLKKSQQWYLNLVQSGGVVEVVLGVNQGCGQSHLHEKMLICC